MRQIGVQVCFEVSAPETLYKLIITGDGQWIDERSTFLAQNFESLFGEGLYLGVGLVRREVLPEDTDACAFEAAALQVSGVVNVGRMRESFGGNRGYRVGRIRPGDYRQQYCSIGHRARHGAAYVVMPKEGNDAGPAGEADSRPDANQRIMRRRTTDGVAGIGTQAGLTEAGGNGRSGSSARSGGNAGEVVRIAGDACDGAGGEIRTESPFGHVRLGQDNRSCRSKPRYH